MRRKKNKYQSLIRVCDIKPNCYLNVAGVHYVSRHYLWIRWKEISVCKKKKLGWKIITSVKKSKENKLSVLFSVDFIWYF